MRILITNTGPWGTGSFTVAKAVAEELLLLGHEVKIFFPDARYPCINLEEYYLRKDIYEIWKFPLQNKQISLSNFPLIIPDPHPRNPEGRTFLQLNKLEYQLYFSDFERKITKLINEFKPDIIECQHIWALDHIIKKLGHRYICVAHHSDQLGFKYDRRMQPIAIESAQNAEYIFAISDYVKQEVLSLYGIEDQKIIVLPNGYDKKVFKSLSVERKKVLKELNLNIPENTKIVSFAGKVSRTKGIDILLQANKLIDPKENLHFLILGSGDIHKVLTDSERSASNFDRVHFLGHKSSEMLAKIHNMADFGVLPSRSEGFGIACLEAMACGLPMIVTKTGGLGDYAIGEKIQAGSVEELAKALTKMSRLSNKEMKDLSDKALKVADKYSWATITESRLEYYLKVCNKI